MIQKKKGNIWVDMLHIILLFEPDFNQHNKKIGKDMMYMAEQFQVLADEQFGSRKCLVAIDHGLNKMLTCNISCQLKQPFALCTNDAKSCYDCIIHSFARIAME